MGTNVTNPVIETLSFPNAESGYLKVLSHCVIKCGITLTDNSFSIAAFTKL